MASRVFLCALAALLLSAVPTPARAQDGAAERPRVMMLPSCARTGGGVAIAMRDGRIYYCLQRALAIERRFPGATRFFFLHEYGHVAMQTGDELLVDCWAAHELRGVAGGRKVLDAARRYVEGFKRYDRKYGGTGVDRSELLDGCYTFGLPWLRDARASGARPPPVGEDRGTGAEPGEEPER